MIEVVHGNFVFLNTLLFSRDSGSSSISNALCRLADRRAHTYIYYSSIGIKM
jgi:hypothetical protein